MNKIIITNAFIGKKGVDLQLLASSGKAVAKYSISVPKDFQKGDKKEYNFFNIVTWGNNAEWISNNAHRIKKINLIGRLESRSYDNKEGIKVYITEIVTDHVEVAEWNNEDTTAEGTTTGITPIEDTDDSEIPF